MNKEESVMKVRDWSLNLEDPYYEDKPDEIIRESKEAVIETIKGCYVNVVTPGKCGDPRSWLIPPLNDYFNAEGIEITDIVYINECGCGGQVTRVYR